MKRIAMVGLLLAGCASSPSLQELEKHFGAIRQLTVDGTHAEAYWSFDGTKLILQAVREGDKADQVYVLDIASGKLTRVSNGEGKCTCSYFLPDGRIVYSSTKASGAEPPPPPDRSKGYRWALYREFEIFLYDPKTGKEERLTTSDGYDAETTVSPDGRRLVFMSQRDDAFNIYTMKTDGSDLRKLDQPRGYTGGPFYSPDGQWLVYRSFYPKDDAQTKELDRMLAERALIPFEGMTIEIYVSRPDGSERRAITETKKINFAPSFFQDGKRVIFTSNKAATMRGGYNLFAVGTDGKNLEQVSFHKGFDGFPVFSPDGKHAVFISDRNARRPHELNVFLAEWKP